MPKSRQIKYSPTRLLQSINSLVGGVRVSLGTDVKEALSYFDEAEALEALPFRLADADILPYQVSVYSELWKPAKSNVIRDLLYEYPDRILIIQDAVLPGKDGVFLIFTASLSDSDTVTLSDVIAAIPEDQVKVMVGSPISEDEYVVAVPLKCFVKKNT